MQKTIIAVIIIFLVSVIIGASVVLILGARGNAVKETEKKTEETAPGETILVSANRGETWEKAKLPGVLKIRDFFVSRQKKGVILAITEDSGIFVKKKDGDSWEKIPFTEIKDETKYYFLNEDMSGNFYISFYAGGRGRVLKYNYVSGKEEEIFETPLSRYAVFGVKVSSSGNTVQLVSSDGGFYESRDAGFTWRIIKRFDKGLLDMELNRVTGEMWLITSENEIFKALDNGRVFRTVSGGLKNFKNANKIEDLFYDEKSGFLYLASSYGLLRAKNGEDNWSALPLILPPQSLPVNAVYTDPEFSEIIYAGHGNRFYKSNDSGASWRVVNLPTERTISKIAVDSLDSSMIYVGLK